jgi:hypothetical protein
MERFSLITTNGDFLFIVVRVKTSDGRRPSRGSSPQENRTASVFAGRDGRGDASHEADSPRAMELFQSITLNGDFFVYSEASPIK